MKKNKLAFIFFANSNAKTSLQVFAKVFAAISFLYYLFRLRDWGFVFSKDSFIPQDFLWQHYKNFYHPLIYWLPASETLTLCLYLFVMFILLVSVFLPLRSFWKALAWFFHIMFFYRNIPAVYGGDLVLNAFFMFYVFGHIQNQKVSYYLLKAAQAQVVIIYFFSGIAKLRGQTWLDGSAVGHIFNSQFLGFFQWDLLSFSPVLSGLLSLAVLVFEVGSPFGFFSSKLRPYWLFAGGVFHASIAIYLGLWFFSLKMLCTYLLFVDFKSLRLVFAKLDFNWPENKSLKSSEVLTEPLTNEKLDF